MFKKAIFLLSFLVFAMSFSCKVSADEVLYRDDKFLPEQEYLITNVPEDTEVSNPEEIVSFENLPSANINKYKNKYYVTICFSDYILELNNNTTLRIQFNLNNQDVSDKSFANNFDETIYNIRKAEQSFLIADNDTPEPSNFTISFLKNKENILKYRIVQINELDQIISKSEWSPEIKFNIDNITEVPKYTNELLEIDKSNIELKNNRYILNILFSNKKNFSFYNSLPNSETYIKIRGVINDSVDSILASTCYDNNNNIQIDVTDLVFEKNSELVAPEDIPYQIQYQIFTQNNNKKIEAENWSQIYENTVQTAVPQTPIDLDVESTPASQKETPDITVFTIIILLFIIIGCFGVKKISSPKCKNK